MSSSATPQTMTIGVTLDCQDVQLLANFWRDALAYDEPAPVSATAPFHALVSPGGGLHHLTLQRVPEPKQAKNRLHMDLFVPDLEREVARLRTLGASIVAEHDEDGGYRTTVMADPEANEFCVVQHNG